MAVPFSYKTARRIAPAVDLLVGGVGVGLTAVVARKGRVIHQEVR